MKYWKRTPAGWAGQAHCALDNGVVDVALGGKPKEDGGNSSHCSERRNVNGYRNGRNRPFRDPAAPAAGYKVRSWSGPPGRSGPTFGAD